MRVLVLGGTDFLGRHIVEAALASGDTVTIFHRGSTHPELFAGEVERRLGDRAGDLASLREGEWDAAIDTSGYFPEHVRAAVRMLAPRLSHYSFVSTLSVYASPIGPSHEDAPVHEPMNGAGRVVTGETYGPLKVACENEVTRAMGERAVIARAGFLVGPHDNVPRLAYWMRRVARGGTVLAPGSPDRLAQLIDARDMARFLLELARAGRGGTFNVTGLPGALTLGEVLETCRMATGSDAAFRWASDEALERGEVPLFDGLPWWVPDAWQSFMRTPAERAHAAGLVTRPIEETIRDACAALERPGETPPHRTSLNGLEIVCGIPPAQEARILAGLEG